jgi:hypothetical protein
MNLSEAANRAIELARLALSSDGFFILWFDNSESWPTVLMTSAVKHGATMLLPR